jgi:uncharacterized protein (DUF1684 family)
MTHIDSKEVLASTGDVTFRLQGTDLRLKSFVEGNKLFLMFQDLTNGAGTYGGGRFLYAPMEARFLILTSLQPVLLG